MADYTNASATVTINVEEATPTITWSNPTDITYGRSLSATQLDATAAVPGVYNPPAGTVLNTGMGQTLSVSFIPTDERLHASSATVMINVDKATPSIAWSQPANITYGSALSATQLDATGLGARHTDLPTRLAGTVLNAGSGQTLSVSFTPTDSTDYMEPPLRHGEDQRRPGDAHHHLGQSGGHHLRDRLGTQLDARLACRGRSRTRRPPLSWVRAAAKRYR